MAKEEMYHIALDDYEHGIIIRSHQRRENRFDETRANLPMRWTNLIIKGRNCPKEKVQSYRKGTLL